MALWGVTFKGEVPCPGIPRRAFRHGGKFEARRRAFGLDEWYTIECPLELIHQHKRRGHIVDLNISPKLASDPFLWKQDHYQAIHLNNKAWRAPCRPVVVHVADDGLDITHEDLQLWVNHGEIPGNGVDDDNNGYVDDVHGYNFIDGDFRGEGHGSHVSGTIAAALNNSKGGRGVAPNARIMMTKVFGDTETKPSVVAEAFAYATENGAQVSSNSWTYPESHFPLIVKEAIDYYLASSPFAVFAAGNDNSDAPAYPAAYDRVVAVGAVDNQGVRWAQSNYGPWVNITAPGVDVFSTVWGPDQYDTKTGSSMACPHVAGVLALGLGIKNDPDLILHCLYDTAANNIPNAALLVDCVANGQKYVVDGVPWLDDAAKCPNAPDATLPDLLRADNNSVAGTRCCSDASSTKGVSICPSGPCEAVSFETAYRACESRGLRLCSVDEVLAASARDSGCNYNYMHVWTDDSLTCRCDVA